MQGASPVSPWSARRRRPMLEKSRGFPTAPKRQERRWIRREAGTVDSHTTGVFNVNPKPDKSMGTRPKAEQNRG